MSAQALGSSAPVAPLAAAMPAATAGAGEPASGAAFADAISSCTVLTLTRALPLTAA